MSSRPDRKESLVSRSESQAGTEGRPAIRKRRKLPESRESSRDHTKPEDTTAKGSLQVVKAAPSPEPILGKRSPQRPRNRAQPHAEMTVEDRRAMNVVGPLIGLVKDPIVKKAKQIKKNALKRVRSGMDSLVVKTALLSNKFHEDPAFDRKIETLPRKAIENLEMVESMDIIIDKNEELTLDEVKFIEQQGPTKREKAEESEKLIQIIKNRTENFERSEFMRRINTKYQLEEAYTFYHNTVRNLATSLGKTPFLCVKCWSILFSEPSLVILSPQKIRIKVACSEVFGHTSTVGGKAVRAVLNDWQSCSNKLLSTEDVNSQIVEYFPVLILPEREHQHDCWMHKGDVATKDLKDWTSYIKTAYSASDSLNLLKGLNNHKIQVMSPGLSSSGKKDDREKKDDSEKKKEREKKAKPGPASPVHAPPGSQGEKVKKEPAEVPDPAPGPAPPAESGPKNHFLHPAALIDLEKQVVPDQDRRSKADSRRDSLKDFIEDDLPKDHHLRLRKRTDKKKPDRIDDESQTVETRVQFPEFDPKSPSSGISSEDPPEETLDLKADEQKWKWFCYKQKGKVVRILIDPLEEAWLEK